MDQGERKHAASELLRRKAARSNLIDFTQFTFPDYKAEPAHRLIAEKLEAVVNGDILRLMIFAPPQHGKSHLASVHLPAFWLAKRPNDPIILTSYAASLAENKSKQTRSLIESPEFATLFPEIRTRQDSRSASDWSLEYPNRGYLLAAGVGGAITGRGALCGIIDDPIENWQEAQSETIRETCWEWYRTTFRTRIWENGRIIIIMTRWHEDDLAGRLLKDQAGAWEVLRLPAIAESQSDRDLSNHYLGLPAGLPDALGRKPGDPLCPGRFSLKALNEFRKDVGPMGWWAQYMGTPRAAEGNRFKRNWFGPVEVVPFKARRVRFWDVASTKDEGDYTVGTLGAFDDETHLFYVEDVIRGQWSAGERDVILKQTAMQDALRYNNTVQIYIEQVGAHGKDLIEYATKMLAGYPVRGEKVTSNSGSKEVRADPLASYAEAGQVRMQVANWNRDFLDELTAFPNGVHDDIVDSVAGAFNKLARGGGQREALRIYKLGGPKNKQLRIVYCTKSTQSVVEIDHPVVLVTICDANTEYVQQRTFEKLLGSVAISFADLDPTAGECQKWDVRVPPTNELPQHIMMTKDHGKQMWSTILRKRPTPPEVIVVQDDGGNDRRGLSVALGICDALVLKREVSLFNAEDPERKYTGVKPLNKHVYDTTRLSRHTVV